MLTQSKQLGVFTPSQPVWLYQGNTHFVIIIFKSVKTGIYIHNFRNILKRWVKHKHNQKWSQILSKNTDCFQKVKNHLKQNILKQHMQWLSCKVALSHFNKTWTSKICSQVKHSSHLMHTGGSSSFNKKEWVMKEWPIWACDKRCSRLTRGCLYTPIYFRLTTVTQNCSCFYSVCIDESLK